MKTHGEPHLREKARTYHLRRRGSVIAANAILIVFVLFHLYPVYMMILNSFKTDTEILSNPAGFPEELTLSSYQAVIKYHGGLLRNFLNSAAISTTSTFGGVLLASMAAFAFAKYRFKGRDLIFALLLGTMMVPSEITVPPLYILFAKLGWLNTYRGLIAPTLTSAFGVFMIRQYMLSIPDSLLEAAQLDGAGHWRLFWQIMVPTSAPVLGAYAILHFTSVWNSYLWPL